MTATPGGSCLNFLCLWGCLPAPEAFAYTVAVVGSDGHCWGPSGGEGPLAACQRGAVWAAPQPGPEHRASRRPSPSQSISRQRARLSAKGR